MVIIGVAGDRGSGKNTFARLCIKYIEENYPELTAREESWAFLLKKSAAHSLGFKFETDQEYNDWADMFKETGSVEISYLPIDEFASVVKTITGREFLQFYGTEGHRDIFSDDFWVDAFWSANEFDESDVVFITDTRFENEAESNIKHDGINIKIANDRIQNEDSHVSEQGLPAEFIYTVVSNHGSMYELKNAAEQFVEHYIIFNGLS